MWEAIQIMGAEMRVLIKGAASARALFIKSHCH